MQRPGLGFIQGLFRVAFPGFSVVPRVGIGIFPGFHSLVFWLFREWELGFIQDLSRISFLGFPVMQRVGIGIFSGISFPAFFSCSKSGTGDLSRIYPGFHSLFFQPFRGWEWRFIQDLIPWFSSCAKAGNEDLSRISFPVFSAPQKLGMGIFPGFFRDFSRIPFPVSQPHTGWESQLPVLNSWKNALGMWGKIWERIPAVSRAGGGGWSCLGPAWRSFPTERIPGFQLGPARGSAGLPRGAARNSQLEFSPWESPSRHS